MGYIDSDDRQHVKDQIRKQRNQKFSKDRRNRHGRRDLAATDGLKPVRKPNHTLPIVEDDDLGAIDLRRVRNFRDLEGKNNA